MGYQKHRWKIKEPKIINYIKQQGKPVVTANQLAEHFGVQPQIARKYLDVLTDEGKLEITKIGTNKKTFRVYSIKG